MDQALEVEIRSVWSTLFSMEKFMTIYMYLFLTFKARDLNSSASYWFLSWQKVIVNLLLIMFIYRRPFGPQWLPIVTQYLWLKVGFWL